MEGTLTAERVVRAATETDVLAASVLKETGSMLGTAIASIINLLNVEVVVLGGGLMAAGDLILEPIRQAAQQATVLEAFQCVRIVPGQLKTCASAQRFSREMRWKGDGGNIFKRWRLSLR
jgi:glucokinase